MQTTDEITTTVRETTLSDALFAWPDGPHRAELERALGVTWKPGTPRPQPWSAKVEKKVKAMKVERILAFDRGSPEFIHAAWLTTTGH